MTRYSPRLSSRRRTLPLRKRKISSATARILKSCCALRLSAATTTRKVALSPRCRTILTCNELLKSYSTATARTNTTASWLVSDDPKNFHTIHSDTSLRLGPDDDGSGSDPLALSDEPFTVLVGYRMGCGWFHLFSSLRT